MRGLNKLQIDAIMKSLNELEDSQAKINGKLKFRKIHQEDMDEIKKQMGYIDNTLRYIQNLLTTDD